MVEGRRLPANRASSREVALQALYQVEAEGAFANLALTSMLRESGLKGPERRLATELVYGTVKMRLTLDWVIGKFLKGRLDQLTPWIRNILRLGVFQLLYLDRVPASAACNESVNLAKRYGHSGTAGLVNGVLRSVVRRQKEIAFPTAHEDPVLYLSVVYSHPAWLVERWLERYGLAGAEALLEFDNTPAPTWVRANSLKISREDLAQRFKEEGITARPGILSPQALSLEGEEGLENLHAFKEGLFQVQDEAAMLVAPSLGPLPGSRVVDACAAPGGKTTHLAEVMGNQGEVLALDVHSHRLGLIRQNCSRLGLTAVRERLLDATRLGEELPGWADYLLVDAPCSGLGVLRRRPDARWRKTPLLIAEMAELQLKILKGAAGCLREGGVLLYCTCSTEPEENYEVVRRFLSENPSFRPEDLNPYLPFRPEREEDRRLAGEGMLQLLPQEHGCEGFFLARLRLV